MSDRIGVADAIESLRREIDDARARLRGDPLLTLARVDIELTVTAEETAKATGGCKFFVLTGELGTTDRQERKHTIRVTLEPKGGPMDIGAPTPWDADVAGH